MTSPFIISDRFEIKDRKVFVVSVPKGTVYTNVLTADLYAQTRDSWPLFTRGFQEGVHSVTGKKAIYGVGYDVFTAPIQPKGELTLTAIEECEWWCVYNFARHIEKWEASSFTLNPGVSTDITLAGDGYILLCAGKITVDGASVVGPTTVTFTGTRHIIADELAIAFVFKDKLS